MWTDYINSTVVPAAQRVNTQCDGTAKVQMDIKNFSIALTELKNSFANLENHLKLRFYLVGHSLTLADVLLVSVLAQTFSLAIDKKTRDTQLPNLTRYVTLAMQTAVLSQTFGQITFCKDSTFKGTSS